MCVVCGCGEPGPPAVAPDHVQAAVRNAHDHSHTSLDYGANPARVSVPGMSSQRVIKLEADVLGENNRIAQHNRQHFEAHGVKAVNLLSSPGSGKTSLLCATIAALRERAPAMHVAVIEGDQQTSFDAERIGATGAQAIQVNTGKGCHLDALMVRDAFARLALHTGSHTHSNDRAHAGGLLFIENVGNLVCPSMWDLGEAAKVVILSVTEGEDKPLKYADMFAAAEVMVLNKIDLLPHLRFDVARCIAYARRVNPRIEVLQLSATAGQGIDEWVAWVLRGTQQARAASQGEARAC